ncbi:type II toxin-antitoxin system PemK/MazF family toxin [Schaalia naturae]|uniref:Type II toxin-antitoxin system PemK/MazF family toxin n=1 Tax=Schaalia naturae TaxID=635203 RepID=A0ABW2SL95_9ACTO
MASVLAEILSAAARGAASRLLSPIRRAPGRVGRAPSAPSSRSPGQATGRTRGAAPSSTRTHPVAVREALACASYDPSPDGDADPGEVVWTWIPYEEDDTQGKDRPVVVLGRAGGGVYVAQMTSKDHDRDADQEARWGRYWIDIGSGPWDPRGRPSEVRLDRVLWAPMGAVRREGAALGRELFETVVQGIEKAADRAEGMRG